MVVAVDFDGTLCEDRYPLIGRANYSLVKTLIALRESGHEVVLWTCRSGQRLKEAVDFCRELGLEFDGVNDRPSSNPDIYAAKSVDTNYRKVFADIYIDDRAITPDQFCISRKIFSKNP